MLCCVVLCCVVLCCVVLCCVVLCCVVLCCVVVIQGNESTTGTTCVVFTVINVTLQECVYPLNYYSIDVK